MCGGGVKFSMIPDKMADQHIGIGVPNKLATKAWFKLYDLQPDFATADENFTSVDNSLVVR